MKKSHGRRPPAGRLHRDLLAVLDARAERPEGVEVRVQPPPADHVTSRRRASPRWPKRASSGPATRKEARMRSARRGVDLRLVHIGRAEDDGVGLGPIDRHAEVGEQVEQGLRGRGSAARCAGSPRSSVSNAQASSGKRGVSCFRRARRVPDSGTPPSITNFSIGAGG